MLKHKVNTYGCIRSHEKQTCYCDGCQEKNDCNILAGEEDVYEVVAACPGCRKNRKPELHAWWLETVKKDMTANRKEQTKKRLDARA